MCLSIGFLDRGNNVVCRILIGYHYFVRWSVVQIGAPICGAWAVCMNIMIMSYLILIKVIAIIFYNFVERHGLEGWIHEKEKEYVIKLWLLLKTIV